MTAEAFRAFAVRATLADAETAYRHDCITREQLTAFEHAWALSAPRFSPLGENLRDRARHLIRTANGS